MIKKLLFLCLIIAGVFAGSYVYQSIQNTPERTAQRFAQELAAGQTDRAYARLTKTLTAGRETYWRDYLTHFKSEAAPELVGQEALKDTFNTYPEHSDPRRFTYVVRFNNQKYQLNIVTLKQNKTWKINELYGGAAAQ